MFMSCSEDFLNPMPTNSLEESEVFKSYNNAEAAMVGVYNQLSSSSFEGLYLPIMADLIGEDVLLNSVDNYNWFVPVYQLNVLPNYFYTESPWTSGYKLIYDANQIIANANKIPDATDDEKNSLIGQAKVLRAFSMLKMVQVYAPSFLADSSAPGILNVTAPREQSSPDIGRTSVGGIYNQIVRDLTHSIELLEINEYTGFFDKRAAQAILARAYLDMQEWELARDMAKVAYEGLELMTADEMLSGFLAPNSETIFSVAYTAEDNNIYLSLPSFYWPVSGYSSMRADSTFVNYFEPGDWRGQFFLDYPEIDPDNYIIIKFGHDSKIGNAEKISIRASEMYLIEAECEAEIGNYTEAQDALYKIQSRANGGVEKSTAMGQELIEEVLLERRKELFGEGFRWNDIKRRNQRFTRNGSHWVKFDFGPEDEDYYRLTFPIPQSEIDANSMLDETNQNIGY